MDTVRSIATLAAMLVLAAPGAAQTPNQCPIESVKVGGVCVDKFEASVWQIPLTATRAIRRVKQGNVTLADLTAAGAVQLGCPFSGWGLQDYPANFPADGNWTAVVGSNPPTPGVYAASVPGVLPSTCITQLQAAQACALSNKRLLRNDEWQLAAASTPDPGTIDDNATDCETGVEAGVTDPVTTGSRASCKSSWGTFDMVGNVWEWVADWSDLAISCTDWTSQTGIAGGDASCFAGPGGSGFGVPGALLRGGDFASGSAAGVFAVIGHPFPSTAFHGFGFRCAR